MEKHPNDPLELLVHGFLHSISHTDLIGKIYGFVLWLHICFQQCCLLVSSVNLTVSPLAIISLETTSTAMLMLFFPPVFQLEGNFESAKKQQQYLGALE